MTFNAYKKVKKLQLEFPIQNSKISSHLNSQNSNNLFQLPHPNCEPHLANQWNKTDKIKTAIFILPTVIVMHTFCSKFQ